MIFMKPRLIMPDEELDRISTGNDKLFYKLFGRDYELELRKKIIALKQGYAWMEKELRL